MKKNISFRFQSSVEIIYHMAPMTTSLKNYPTRVPVKREGKTGSIALDQIRTIDKQRIVKTGSIAFQKKKF